MESSIVKFHQQLYMPAIQKLSFHLPLLCIPGTHHCGNTRRETINNFAAYQYVLCRQDYSERLVDRFLRQIQS